MKNVYNTTDPEVLLSLKRQEALAMRDVIRSMNQAHLKPEHIFKIAQNTLLAQLGVRKMAFFYKQETGFQTGLKRGFPEVSDQLFAELPSNLELLHVSPIKNPILSAFGAEYVVPVQFRNDVGAWFVIADFAESDAERENDLIFVETLSNVLSAALENRNLVQEIVQQEALKKELELAGKIQAQLLSYDFSNIQGGEIAALNVPHSQVGGDFYDVISRGEKGFFVCIADVAGKGMAAALLMASLQASLRALILSEDTLESVIRKLHQNIYRITQGDKFVTLFLAHVKIQTREIDYINAGHNPPWLISGNQLLPLEMGTIPLGILDLSHLEQGTLPYQAGDQLFLYTDGLVEQENLAGEMMGEETVEELLAESPCQTAAEMLARVNESYSQFGKGVDPADDITMMAIRLL